MTISSYIDYKSVNCLPEVWPIAAREFSLIIALDAPHLQPKVALNYQELAQKIQCFATGLQALGVNSGDKIALFADNSPRWMIADQGIMTAGGVDVVRSASAEKQELLYIYNHSDSNSLVVENLKTFNRLSPQLEELPLNFVILLADEEIPETSKVKILTFSQLLELGSQHNLEKVDQDKSTLATLIYTSGTTGKPKGVMLSHGNLLHQVNNLRDIITCNQGDRVLTILPSWHAYERSAEYFLLSQGCTQYYTNLRSLKSDLKKYRPHYMVGVPRLWESLYEGIQKQFREQSPTKQKLINWFFNLSQQYIRARRLVQGLDLENLQPNAGTKLWAILQTIVLYPCHLLGDKIVYQKVRAAVGAKVKTFVSGGGSLAKHLDDFYEIVNIPVLVGYGLTETAPVTNARSLERNIAKTAGQPIAETEIKIVDPETRATLPTGKQGLVMIRGTQVMQGYYKNPEATAKAIDAEGWFDSGDLGWVTAYKDLVLTGRAKDTIVLTNGENIEPQPIEDACIRSKYIDQIMLVGQDQKALGALIVPNLETLQQWITEQNLELQLPSAEADLSSLANSDLYSQPIQTLFRQELTSQVQDRPGYRSDDRISSFRFILEHFSQDNGLMTQTFKIKRPQVKDKYQDLINQIYNV